MTEDLDLIDSRADALVQAHIDLLKSLVSMRKRHGLSQEAVAERMGVSQPTVAAFERYDANPTLSTIRRYALAVQARIEERVIDDCAAHRGPASPSTLEAILATEPVRVRAGLKPSPRTPSWRQPEVTAGSVGG